MSSGVQMSSGVICTLNGRKPANDPRGHLQERSFAGEVICRQTMLPLPYVTCYISPSISKIFVTFEYNSGANNG